MLRAAATLRGLGMDPLVLAVVSTLERRAREDIEGIPIVRIEPVSPAVRVIRHLRRRPAASATRASAANPSAAPSSAPHTARRVTGLVRLHRWLTTLSYYRLGAREVLRRRPELVHCNDYNTMWIGVFARLVTGARVVYDAHELWPDRNQRPEPRAWLLACEWLFVRVAHRTITTSPGYAEVMARRYRIPPPQVVRNIPARVAPLPTEHRPARNGAVTAVYVGAVTTNRGLEEAVQALAHSSDLRLRVIGPGRDDYRAGIAELAARVGVADRLELLDPVPPGELVDCIRDADAGLALIQPGCLSYQLSLPNKIFEYLAAGLPVVGSDLPVMGAFIRDERVGLTAAPHDPAAIARAIERLGDPALGESLRARVAEVAARLTWDREAAALAGVYTGVLGG